MNDWADLGVGAVGGALFSELLKLVIKGAKEIRGFKPLSKDLVSTMERLLPLTKIIDSKQNELELGIIELKELRDTIESANKAIQEFPSVSFYNKSKYTRKIEKINEDMLKFCQIELQLLQYRNQLEILRMTRNIRDLVPVFRNLCSVPKLDKVLLELEWPVMEVKKKLLDNSVVNLVVSAPAGSGKTTLVMQLCDDPEIKGKFKHILYNVVTSTPNFRVIVQNLLEHNGYRALTFENDPQALVVLRQLLENLQEKGPILMVLDDVWPGAEFFLQNFQINIPNYKILVTSRSDFPSFGFNYHLRPLKDEDATALQVQWASQPDNVSRAEYEDLLQKLSLINEQQEKEEKIKYKAEAHLFTTIKVARDVDFTEQIGNNVYFDLVDHEKVWSFRIQKQTPFHQFKEEVAKDLCVPVQLQRFWIWAKRQNNTYRPHRPLLPTEELLTVEQIREMSIKANNADELKLYLEIEYGPNYCPILLPGKSSKHILLFFKLYDPKNTTLRYVGRLMVKSSSYPMDIVGQLITMAGFAPYEEIELFEEIMFEPFVMCECVDKKTSFRRSQIQDGDIICYQKLLSMEESEYCLYPDVPSFLEYVHKNREIPLAQYLPTWRENVIDVEMEMNPGRVLGMSLSVNAEGGAVGAKSGPGDFRVEIDWIKALRLP